MGVGYSYLDSAFLCYRERNKIQGCHVGMDNIISLTLKMLSNKLYIFKNMSVMGSYYNPASKSFNLFLIDYLGSSINIKVEGYF